MYPNPDEFTHRLNTSYFATSFDYSGKHLISPPRFHIILYDSSTYIPQGLSSNPLQQMPALNPAHSRQKIGFHIRDFVLYLRKQLLNPAPPRSDHSLKPAGAAHDRNAHTLGILPCHFFSNIHQRTDDSVPAVVRQKIWAHPFY